MSATELKLDGFVADSPLGFVAALGLLRLLDRQRPDWSARLSWQRYGFWRARISVSQEGTTFEDLAEATWLGLEGSKAQIEALASHLDRNLNIERPDLRAAIEARAGRPDGRMLERLVAELPASENEDPRSRIQLLNGAGRQDFLPALVALARHVTRDQLRRTLESEGWTHEDDARGGLNLRLDSSADRSHALLSADPDDMPMTTELAANRLAVEAFEIFPVFPGTSASTTGFHRIGRSLIFRWPIWTSPLTWPEIAVMITLPSLAEPIADRVRLRVLGVEMVFEAERRVIGKGKTLMGPSRAIPL